MFVFSFLSEKEKENGVKSSACISQGCYSFSFKFIIPDKYLPTSFEGRHGNIRYWVRAVIDRGLGKSNVKTKPAPFMIGDYVALEDFENVSVRRVHSLATFSVFLPVDINEGCSDSRGLIFYICPRILPLPLFLKPFI